ncbi:ATP-binding cassette domain-containing protein [Saccharothrix sp. AJ9571]|nr:ATP-binding cassette domain-containing protein [Saccharothrix sp. AJ9571]
MIQVRELSKRYGRTTAVDNLSFTVRPGGVTGFLGPNGAGKSTTMRIVLGLDAPDAGEALVGGRRYTTIERPMHEVGALLDANAVHPGRSAYDHLLSLALTNGLGRSRVRKVLEEVGLADVARKRAGKFSLGMKQRLGLASALLGDPAVLLLDEPVNGLDPDGVRWIRELLRSLAAEGRTVLVSSHLMSEMALTADRLIVIGRGRLIADTSVRELEERFQRGVFVRSPRAVELSDALREAGAEVIAENDEAVTVHSMGVDGIGELAAARGIPVYEVIPRSASLEEAYLELTADSVDYQAVR